MTLPRIIVAAMTLAALAPTQDSTPTRGELWVALIGDGALARLDLDTGKFDAPIAVGRSPHEIALTPDGKRAVVANYGAADLAVVDLDDGRVIRRIPLRRELDGAEIPFPQPHGIALLTAGRALVTAEAQQRLLAVDLDEERVTAAWHTGARMSHMVTLVDEGRHAVVSNKTDGSICVFDTESGNRLRTIATGAGAQGMAVRPGSRELWVGNINANTIAVVDLDTWRITRTVNCPDYPVRIAFSPDGSTAAISHYRPGTVSLWDGATAQLRTQIKLRRLTAEEAAARPVPAYRKGFADDTPMPVGLIAHPEGRYAYVGCTRGHRVIEIDLESAAVSRDFAAGREPDGMVWRH